jgi:hypothetical protein
MRATSQRDVGHTHDWARCGQLKCSRELFRISSYLWRAAVEMLCYGPRRKK